MTIENRFCSNCIFCKIIEQKESILLEDEHFILIKDKQQLVKGHYLILPKSHLTVNYFELKGELFPANLFQEKLNLFLIKVLDQFQFSKPTSLEKIQKSLDLFLEKRESKLTINEEVVGTGSTNKIEYSINSLESLNEDEKCFLFSWNIGPKGGQELIHIHLHLYLFDTPEEFEELKSKKIIPPLLEEVNLKKTIATSSESETDLFLNENRIDLFLNDQQSTLKINHHLKKKIDINFEKSLVNLHHKTDNQNSNCFQFSPYENRSAFFLERVEALIRSFSSEISDYPFKQIILSQKGVSEARIGYQQFSFLSYKNSLELLDKNLIYSNSFKHYKIVKVIK